VSRITEPSQATPGQKTSIQESSQLWSDSKDLRVVNPRVAGLLRGDLLDAPPIWFMRQAGRYHRHYQELKKHHSFEELCLTPSLAAEVALGPVLDFDFDLAILFSDLPFPLMALGMDLSYQPGPVLARSLLDLGVKSLRSTEEALPRLAFQAQAMRLTRERLPKHKSLVGFVGGCFTLFTYAVEGAHRGALEKSKAATAELREFLPRIEELVRENIRAQLDAGAELVMVLDTSAGEIDPESFRRWVVPTLSRWASEFPGRLAYYSKGVTADHYAHQDVFHDGRLAGLGFDHRWDLAKLLRERRSGFVQGNFDQALLFLPTHEFKSRWEDHLNSLKSLPRTHWMAGLGHGILPGTPEEHVRYCVNRLREWSKENAAWI
jgi:uroporphyrinogen decarboxylase